MLPESGSPWKEGQLDHHGNSDDLSSEIIDQAAECFCGSARREQIVVDQYTLPRTNCAAMELEQVLAVFQFIGTRDDFSRELARLSADAGFRAFMTFFSGQKASKTATERVP